MSEEMYALDCHDILTKKDREHIHKIVKELLADQGITNTTAVGFNLTAYYTLNPKP